MSSKMFRNRAEAGRTLAVLLRSYADEDPIVLALPRGGVPVAFEVAHALGAPLDVWLVRKIGAPASPEVGIGAVSEGGAVYIDDELVERLKITPAHLLELIEEKGREVAARIRKFRGLHPRPVLLDRTVIVVDDGIATGVTIRAVLRSIKDLGARQVVVAVPVAAIETVRALKGDAARVVCLLEPDDLEAIGLWYEDFTQVPDQEVERLLALAQRERKFMRGKAVG